MPDAKKITGPLLGLTGCFVAGGAVTSLYTNKPINDLDVYPKSQEAYEEAIRWAYEEGRWNTDASSRAITFGSKEDTQIQIMHFDVFPTAEAVFETFDFTCCMGAYDLDEGRFILDDRFLEHCSQRFISFNPKTRFPYASAWRVKKYTEKGFTIGKMEFQKILMACAAKPISSWDDLKDQIGGVYGESVEIPQDMPFSIEAAYAALGALTFYARRNTYGSADEAIALTSNVERRYVEVAQEGLAPVILSDMGEGFQRISRKPKRGVKAPLVEAFPGLTFYKKVIKREGRYHSAHRHSFTYEMGQVASSPSPYIFAYPTIGAARNHWVGDERNAVILELQCEEEADITFGVLGSNAFQLKKCRVVAEHSAVEPVSAAA